MMRQPNHRACAVTLFAALFVPSVLAAQSGPRIAVLPLQNNTPHFWFRDQLGEAAADELTTQLVKTAGFRVIERQQLDAILAEQSDGMSGIIDPATAARVGKVAGVQLVVAGSITKFSIDEQSAGIGSLKLSASYKEAESMLDLRVIDTSTGEILAVVEGEGRARFGGARLDDIDFEHDYDAGIAHEALRPAVEDAVERIVAQREELVAAVGAAPAIEVVGVRDGQIYIDSGQNGGLTVGQRLTVMRVVDVIRDSRGEVLDEITENVATLEVTRVLSQSSVCRIVDGSDVKEGDRIASSVQPPAS